MAFIWRRRSTTIVKLVFFLLAIWFCIAFLVYTDDTRRRASQDAGASAAGSALGGGAGAGAGGLGDPIALALRNEPAGDDLGINGNVIGGADGRHKPARDEADIPPTVGKHKDLAEKLRKRAQEHPKPKPVEGESITI